MMEGYNLSIDNQETKRAGKLEILEEVARRATWDALYGPRHLRSGCFTPSAQPQNKSIDKENGNNSTKQPQV